jgi:RimJ/RimL family protein N-acetyltransferase
LSAAPPFELRPLRLGDLDLLVDLDSDPMVMEHITGGRASPRALLAVLLLPRMLARATRPGMGFFVLTESGQEQGWLHLREDAELPDCAELGYRLRRSAWGRGLATSAGRWLVDRAFRDLGCRTVSARTVPENRASRRVMEKLGMRLAGGLTFPARDWPGLRLPECPGLLYRLDRPEDGGSG